MHAITDRERGAAYAISHEVLNIGTIQLNERSQRFTCQ